MFSDFLDVQIRKLRFITYPPLRGVFLSTPKTCSVSQIRRNGMLYNIETPDSEEKQENITREIESVSADTDKQEVQAEDDDLYFDDSFLFEDENTEPEADE